MTRNILMIMLVGMLSACISGVKPPDTYVGRDGKTTVIESDREMCRRACNDDYSRCMETTPAKDSSGVNGSTALFGASGDCRTDLQHCLPTCKSE